MTDDVSDDVSDAATKTAATDHGSPPDITPDGRGPSVPTVTQLMFAELVGTFGLVYCACGAMLTSGNVAAIGLAWGLAVAAMIFAIGPISGAHINPAVSFGFALHGSFRWSLMPAYVAAQFVGALAGVVATVLTFSVGEITPAQIGVAIGTFPARSDAAAAAFVAEVLHTTVLMLVILRVAFNAKGEGLKAGLAIGSTVGLLALAGGAAGASMNPARTVWCNLLTDRAWLEIYFVAPFLGAAIAVGIDRLLGRSDEVAD